MAENIVNTYNLFIDTSRGHSADSQGDNFHLNLGHAGVVCDAGQYIRMTLNNFSMHKTFSDINETNNSFRLIINNTGPPIVGNLTERNNTTLTALAEDFRTQIKAALQQAPGIGAAIITDAGSVKPNSQTIGGDTDYIISFLLSYDLPASRPNTVTCQFLLEQGDSNEILGGDRIENSADTTTPSIDIKLVNANLLEVKCRYPAQRQTIDFVYLRCLGIPNTSIETLGLTSPTESHTTDTTDSTILAKIPVQTEYCTYDAQSGREFFMNIRQKNISNLRLHLTDRHNRPLARQFNSSSKTATGSGVAQSTLGNLSFNAVVRFDIIQQRHIKELETEPVQQITASRFENVLSQPKFGRDQYGYPVGR
jgi:hypothetical protein